MERQVAWAYGVAGLALAVATAAFVGANLPPEAPPVAEAPVEERVASREGPASVPDEVVYVDERGNPVDARAGRHGGGEREEDDEEGDERGERGERGEHERGEHEHERGERGERSGRGHGEEGGRDDD